ncbi:MAG: GGDEF domain-containing protein, partial [Algicola sp.]|nr:GGDEF domain-containing protein [Algicola sp.]
MRLLLLLFSFLLLPTWLVSAATASAHFERLSVTDGMSQSSALAILQDSQGFMWFGTEDGLNRYDGYQFVHYRHDTDDSGSLSSSYISALFEDSEQNLWVGTGNGGLNRFDSKHQRFERFIHEPDDSASLSSNLITAITQDNQGTLWVSTRNGLNARKAGQTGFKQFKHNPLDPHSLSHNGISSVVVDSKGLVWVSTMGGGVNRFDTNTGHFEHFGPTQPSQNPQPDDIVLTLFEDAQGTLWSGSYKGLAYFEPTAGQFVDVKLAIPIVQGRPGIGTANIGQGPKGNLWIATFAGGVHQFNPKTAQLIHYQHQNTDSNSLSKDTIMSIYTDAKGLLWIGTLGAGVNKLNTRRLRFGHVKHNPKNPDSLNYSSVTSITQDAQNNLWIGTSQLGVNKKEPKHKSHHHGFETLANNPNDPYSLSNNVVNAVSQGTNGTLWVGTLSGLNHYNPLDGRFTRYNYDKMQPQSLSNNHVIHLLYDSKGTLWVATAFGLNRFKAQSGTFETLLHDPSNPNSLSNSAIMRVFEDHKGFLWIATNSGLNQYDAKNNRFVRYHHDKNDPTSLSHDGVISIAQDNEGTLWVGTNGGLNKFDSQTQSFKQYRVKDGLPNDVIYAILPDNQGHIWVSTNAGLSKFNPNQQTFKNFDVNDGLQSNEFNSGTAFKSSDGEFYFGGINGYNHFYPSTITDDTLPPKVVLTEFLLFNQPVPVINPLNTSQQDTQFTLPQSIGSLTDLTLDHQHNLLTFEFAALDFSNPMKNRYAYKLEGQDQNWITASAKNRRATYTNLAAGDYTLQVKASNKDGYWNEQGKALNITVLPPWWLSNL